MTSILYTGLTVPKSLHEIGNVIHYPVIKVVPNNPQNESIQKFYLLLDQSTHLIFTSKTAVNLFFEWITELGIGKIPQLIAVGKATADEIRKHTKIGIEVADKETAEGVVALLQEMTGEEKKLFLWPHSGQARSVITDYFESIQAQYYDCIFYQVEVHKIEPKPDLSLISEVHFTSPSTVDGFFSIYGIPPGHMRVHCIGPVTKNYLEKKLFNFTMV